MRSSRRSSVTASADTEIPTEIWSAWISSASAWLPIAKYAIFPIQDLCLMGSDARMNTPGVAAANWAFRYVKEDLTQERKNWLLKTTRLFGRCPLGPEDYTA